ncbi:hypothetical protein A5703_21360 [Mycobacterium sp. E188]|nr:hypothetical protein A5703_21360 [Mycobacterium sp. E188]OBH36468.1 hypothetical protein A5691_03835 [Mycobacterium sp. E183]
MAHPLPGAFIPRTHPAIRADLGAPAGRADLGAPAVPAGRRADLVGRVAPVIRAGQMVPVDPEAPIIQADPAARAGPTTQAALVAPADRADRAVRGTEILSAATSAAPRGVTVRRLGDPVRRLAPRGTGRSPRPVDIGGTVRSTTGAIRRPRCGTPASISGASGSSECGFRCKPQ